MTMPYFMARSNWFAIHLNGRALTGENMQQRTKLTVSLCFLPMPGGYICIYLTIIFMNPLGQSTQNFMWSLLGKENEIWTQWSRLHSKVAAMPICGKNHKKYSYRTESQVSIYRTIGPLVFWEFISSFDG